MKRESARGDGEAAQRTATECERFVDGHYERVFAWFQWLVRDPDRAADLTQDTFAAFWESLDRRKVREPRLWLHRIARNRWRKHCRAARLNRVRGQTEREPVANWGNPALNLADSELAEIGAELVKQLPLSYREAVVLRYWCDFSHKEIAVVQRIPGSLARWRVHRGRALLRTWLGRGDQHWTGG